MKGNSSSGYDESMKVVRDPGKNGRTETFFFREKLGRGGIKRENQAEVWADDHNKDAGCRKRPRSARECVEVHSSSGIMKCVVLAKFPGKMIVNTGNLQ